MPAVSVVIPAYNHAKFLKGTIQSALAQTWRNYEIIVVDDGSTDNTRDVVASFSDPRIRYIFQDNQGLSGARNTGIRAAGGEYLAFLDSDDEFEPEFLHVCVEALTIDRALGAVHTATRFIDQSSQILPRVEAYTLAGEAFKRQLRRGGFFPPVSAMARAECVHEAGLFDTTLTSLEDWDMWLRINQRHPMRSLPQPLVRYRVYPGSMSTNAPRMLANRLAVIAKHVGEPNGDPATWPAEKREMYAYAYRTAAFEYNMQGEADEAWRYLNQAVSMWPAIFTQLDTCYEASLRQSITWLSRRGRSVRVSTEMAKS